jgi:hypothetical protein
MKIDQQTHGDVQQTKMRQQLSLIHRMQRFFAFRLDDNPSLHNRLLPFYAEPELFNFMSEAGLVRGFQQTRAELAVNPNCGANDLLGEVTIAHAVIPSSPSFAVKVFLNTEVFNRKVREGMPLRAERT